MASRAVDAREVTLCELLDRILNKGVVIAGDVVISVADVDLIYLGLKLILTSVETLEKHKPRQDLSCRSRYALGATAIAAPEATLQQGLTRGA
jgi:hypothetical protein